MQKINFLKLASRLGLKNLPNGQTELNLGVEQGADAVLSASFLQDYPTASVIELAFPAPESLRNFNQELAFEYGRALDFLTQKHDSQTFQVAVGGDHSVSFLSVANILNHANPKSIGFIQIDSHTDLHKADTSPSGNFHGMWLRALIEPIGTTIDNIKHNALPSENILFIGNLDMEPAELAFVEQNNIRTVSQNELRTNPSLIKDFVSKFTHIHISFDIDALHKSLAPATGIPAANGLLQADLDLIFAILKDAPIKSIDLVEVNPTKPGGKKTVELAQKILTSLISYN